MTAEHYMALADLQTVWDDKMKPFIQQQVGTIHASTTTCEDVISEIIHVTTT